MIGTPIAHYQIIKHLGSGGMGDVYQATDAKLDRSVAIKLLPQEFARDAERVARFEREARVLASLNHPNIAEIHGLEESDGRKFLVMELVPGETLADRIKRDSIPTDEALTICRQIAEALEAANEKGIIHRDLKPANVKITPDGKVKLLDFGLAKGFEAEAENVSLSNSPTISVAATNTGVILGTAAYMSPEQAVGKPTDRRTDIFSFDALLYEMLTGRAAFGGESTGDLLAAVVKDQPDWSALPAEVPAAVRRLLERCLTKDRKQRLQAIGEARILLENLSALNTTPAAEHNTASRRLWIVAASLIIVLAAIALWGWLRPTSSTAPGVVTRFTANSPLRLPAQNFLNGVCCAVQVSPDGARIAFIGAERSGPIYVRQMDQLEARVIPGTEGANSLAFSPDSQWLAYYIRKQNTLLLTLKKVPVTGGPAQTIAEIGRYSGNPFVNWGDDDALLIGLDGGIGRIPAAGGDIQTIIKKSGKPPFRSAQLLPDRTNVLISGPSDRIVSNSDVTKVEVAVVNSVTGQKKVLLEAGGAASYAPTQTANEGHIVYWLPGTGSLFAVPFDAKRLELRGSTVPVIEGIRSVAPNVGYFGFSKAGTLAYVPTGAGSEAASSLVWVDRKGVEQPLSTPEGKYSMLRLSPDGERVAVQVGGAQFENQIWVADISRGSHIVIAPDGRSEDPTWTPDGNLIYASATNLGRQNSTLVSVPGDGSGAPSVLFDGESTQIPRSISSNGKVLIGDNVRSGIPASAGSGLWVLTMTQTTGAPIKPQPFLDDRGVKRDPQFSPDGRWVAYSSNESGREEIYVVPYPGPGAKIPISNGGGRTPRWSRSGRELFYRSSGAGIGMVFVVDVQANPPFRAGIPKKLFEGNYLQSYDVSPDGQRFLMIKLPPADEQRPELHLVLNWFAELRRLAPFSK